MNIALMRWMDYWLGVPACALLSGISRVGRSFSPSPTPRTQGARVLFIELSEMGSMVAALPTLAKAKTLSPDAELYFLTFAKNRKCLEMIQAVPPENVFCIRETSLIHLLGDMLKVLWQIRALRMDYAVDMEVFSRVSAVLTSLCRAKLSSGFHAYYTEGLYRGTLHTHPVSYNPYHHIGYNFLALVRGLTLPPTPDARPMLKAGMKEEPLTIPRLSGAPNEREAVRDILVQAGWQPETCKRLILINPNGGLLPIRAWPLEYYIELIRDLLKEEGWTVAIMGIDGAADDAQAIRQAIGATPQLLDVTNAFSFAQLIPLFEEADLLITNDGGPAHFAALTDCEILVFFGPETPVLYGPLSAHAESLYSDYACSPCLSAFNHRNSTCTDNQCLKVIPPATVAIKARDRLQAREPR